jgi:hypothetical protein
MTEPFTQFIKPYFRQHYAGEVIIETIWYHLEHWSIFLVGFF